MRICYRYVTVTNNRLSALCVSFTQFYLVLLTSHSVHISRDGQMTITVIFCDRHVTIHNQLWRDRSPQSDTGDKLIGYCDVTWPWCDILWQNGHITSQWPANSSPVSLWGERSRHNWSQMVISRSWKSIVTIHSPLHTRPECRNLPSTSKGWWCNARPYI